MDGWRFARAACALIGVLVLSAAVTAPAADARYAKRTLKPGSEGTDVKRHQRYLTRAGFRVRADGRYGGRTRRAQRRFERRVERRRDGRASRSDQRLLRRLLRRGSDGTGGTKAGTDVGNAGSKAVLAADGRIAIAPDGAPQEVKDAIAAANRITRKQYRYGGGHGKWDDSGYDCSGAVSYALHGAGLLDRPLPSGPMMRWGKRGRGDWITVYAHEGHAYVVIAGLRFDTSRGRGGERGAAAERGPRWRTRSRSSRGFTARHPGGL
jgi:cell wall-associated NlpC family hydrolase